jgi:hypothetical protein
MRGTKALRRKVEIKTFQPCWNESSYQKSNYAYQKLNGKVACKLINAHGVFVLNSKIPQVRLNH